METIVALTIGVVLAVLLRRERRNLLRIAVAACVILLSIVLVQLGSGWPVFRARTASPSLDAPTAPHFAEMHRIIGHSAMAVAAMLFPVIVAAAFQHASGWRRIVHIVVPLGTAVLWCLLAFSGYLLPRDLPAGKDTQAAATLLRFAVLHMTGLPGIAAMLLGISGWRHWRALKLASGEPLPPRRRE